MKLKSIRSKSLAAAVAIASLAMVFTGCSSTVPTDTPGVERMGRYVLKQYGPELWTLLGYRFANSQIGDEWMILEVGLSSPNGQSAKVTRDDVFLRAPDGTRVRLATQREFNEAYGSLRPVISRASVDRDPLYYFPPSRRECAVQFFVAPGG
ncbi:MAG: hypothetical protein P8127_11730, partial [Acidobacteriota bacterium]